MWKMPSPAARHRWSVTARILAAGPGGYVLASLISVFAAQAMRLGGVTQGEAVLSATIGGFLVYAVIVMAIFHMRTALRGWGLIAGTAIPVAVLDWLMLDGAWG